MKQTKGSMTIAGIVFGVLLIGLIIGVVMSSKKEEKLEAEAGS